MLENVGEPKGCSSTRAPSKIPRIEITQGQHETLRGIP